VRPPRLEALIENCRPLVSVLVDDTVVAVCREPDGSTWLTERRSYEDLWLGGTGMSGSEPVASIGGDWIHLGGLLPPGATTAEVTDSMGVKHRCAVGDGAWVALTPNLLGHPGEPIVAYRDEDGGPVKRPPSPKELRREPVEDATERCPACEEKGWDLVTEADPYDRGNERMSVTCRTCGHAEATGMFVISWTVEEDYVPDPAAEAEMRLKMSRDAAAAVANARCPLVGLARWTGARSVNGWGGTGDAVEEVTLAHGNPEEEGPWITVSASVGDTFRGVGETARGELANLVGTPKQWPELSEPALSLWLSARRREGEALASSAPRAIAPIGFDGELLGFHLFSAAGHWTAVARIGATEEYEDGDPAPPLTIMLASHGVPASDIALESADPAPYLADA
jgi:hypothetical protein